MTAAAVASVRARHRDRAPWPYGELDIAEQWAGGWRPTPVQDVVLKVHQRCNLACDYCYVYTQEDRSWHDRPAVMSAETWRATVDNLRRHVQRHQLSRIRVILHGGEPLLLGAARIGELASELRAALEPGCAVEIGLQTNGVLLREKVLEHLRRHRIKVAVSIDGTPADHDRHRVRHNGRGTFATVSAALDLLRRPENRTSYAGLLCTVAPDTDPVATYATLRAFEPPVIDFLLPHANWEHPPPRPAGPHSTPYGDWLVAAFTCWYEDVSPPGVRLFDDVIALLLGGPGSSEQLGVSPVALVVIESDGSIEQVDTLKSAYPGAPATGLHVQHDELDAVLDDPGVVARQIGLAALSEECLTCPVHQVCGAGHYVHRYRPGSGFRNRSVYCADLRRLIDHVRTRVGTDVRELIGVSSA
jgi:uncharacterized protein